MSDIAPLNIQLFDNEKQIWQDAAILHFESDYRPKKLEYDWDYAVNNLLQDNNKAISLRYPVDLFGDGFAKDFAFLEDIVPAGASRRYWLQALNLKQVPEFEQNYQLLKQATIAPIGHLRIKEAVPESDTPKYFDKCEVIERNHDFLEYAQQNGAMAGGATGAGGEAPKLLLRQNPAGQVWIDNQQNQYIEDDYFLVKYPRNQRTPRDCDILRAEFHFYHELTAMGFDTISTQKMRLEEGEKYPSLWLPRFDVVAEDGKIRRYAMESVYSLMGKSAGSYLKHQDYILQIMDLIEKSDTVQKGFVFDRQNFISGCLKRDLLNIVFGNSDNHGRNTAILRDKTSICLTPIYDFAPMRADSEEIIRTSTWGKPLEEGGEYRFREICQLFEKYADSEQLWQDLRDLAAQLVDLKSRLHHRGVPPDILNLPTLQYDFLPKKLTKWDLL